MFHCTLKTRANLQVHSISAGQASISVNSWRTFHRVKFRDKIPHRTSVARWASYQIPRIAGCACAGNAGNVFPRRRFQRKLLVSDPGMHHGTCVTHVPWCMSGSLTCGDGENVPGIPGACATRNFAYLARGPWLISFSDSHMSPLYSIKGGSFHKWL